MLKYITLTAAIIALGAPALAQASDTKTAPVPAKPSYAFSPVIVANNTIYLAGHLGRTPGTNMFAKGGIGPQTTQALENIGRTLETVNATHADLVHCLVFLADMDDFSEMNEAYIKFFPDNPPTRTTVAVSRLAADADIEIDCTGIVGHSGN